MEGKSSTDFLNADQFQFPWRKAFPLAGFDPVLESKDETRHFSPMAHAKKILPSPLG